MSNQYWEKEEFEELVATGLIAMYETNVRKIRDMEKSMKITPEILSRIQKIGCYFPAGDRIVAISQDMNGKALNAQSIDVVNDGRPNSAIICYPIGYQVPDENSMRHGSYLEICYMEKIPEFPKPFRCDFSGKRYRLVKMWMKNNFIEGAATYVVIDHAGNVYEAYRFRNDYNSFTGLSKIQKVLMSENPEQKESQSCENIITIEASATIQAWQDRRYLWNVVANEGIAKATFSVYPEQIKSLFYARDLPMTETGRKRPILHWVSAHLRRIKKGIDIDIEKHLRGCNEFVYQGTNFKITNPQKITKDQ